MRILFLLLTLPLIFACRTTAPAAETGQERLTAELSRIESRYGARIGLFFLDTETGETAAYRADERFAFCSTFKALTVGFFLLEADEERMNERIFFTEDDLLSWAPVCRTKTAAGMTAAEICEAALRFSDNTAANLLFDLLGGPKELTKRLNALGDSVTLSVRREPYLNEFLPGKPDDTTTPKQAARSLYALCEELKAADNEKLTLFLDWMSGNDTGKTLIRAGVEPVRRPNGRLPTKAEAAHTEPATILPFCTARTVNRFTPPSSPAKKSSLPCLMTELFPKQRLPYFLPGLRSES